MREESAADQVHVGQAVLDIGEDIGALVIYTGAELRGREIEVSLLGGPGRRTHTAVLERSVGGGRTIYSALFLALLEGVYTIWGDARTSVGVVTITGGQVAEVDWRVNGPAFLPQSNRQHPHEHKTMRESYEASWIERILPPRYQGKAVCATPMAAASLIYDADGQVAWDQIWTDFCDLALAGGPPHRGTLLEPVAPEVVRVKPEAYKRVVAEIERGLRLVTGLTTNCETPGWVGLVCTDEEMAVWLLRAIVVENVCVRREGRTVFLPAGPDFVLEKEIKNVVTVVAKTHHYWAEHIAGSRVEEEMVQAGAW